MGLVSHYNQTCQIYADTARNMFLAAAPYFQRRFESDERLLRNFQSVELSVSTVGNLGSIIVLTKLQARASYPKRIIVSLLLNAAIFALLAISTRHFLNISVNGYFAFFVVVVFFASLATALCQNGVFAYVSSFGRPEYTQAIMTGQGIAGVLPCITQIISVLSVPEKMNNNKDAPQESSTSAFVYFLTATVISAITLAAFVYLLSRHSSRERTRQTVGVDEVETASVTGGRKAIPLLALLRKLFWLAGAVFLSFAITMIYPVFTQQILSVRDPATAPRLFQPSSYIPLGFLLWNTGDLIGRVLPGIPALSLTSRPRLVFLLTVCRVVFLPMYLLCNVGGKGATFSSDAFYLLVVQLLFGVSNGYIGSTCMMGFAEWVDVEEREAAGGFMSLCLVAGLTVGSFLSFFAAGA
jgi:equilibrative nucleoside transporter 1/2/3